MRLTR